MNTEKKLNTHEGRWKTNLVLNVDSEFLDAVQLIAEN